MSNGPDRSPSEWSSVVIELPSWVDERVGDTFASVEDRMDLVLGLAERNIADDGGPFAAAVFDDGGRLVAAGVNRVVPSSIPIAHAEIVAIAAAGQRLGTWDIGSVGPHALVTTTEPCAMCLGAVPWSGVDHLVCGARDEDARNVGFDEGRKPDDWITHLESIGIAVTRDVRRAEAARVLEVYASRGGPIYNGGV